MSEIRVTPMEPTAFGVEIDEDGVTTGHRVIVPPTFWEEHMLLDVDEATAVRESVLFLLERQPGTVIPQEISLDQISSEHADFDDELRSRLSV